MPRSRRRRARAQGLTRPMSWAGSHFTREGSPKNAYRTESEARGAAQLAWTLERVDLDAYRCDYCHQWHIGRRFRDG
ncbi:MAG TPA: hypothetical protein VFN59_05700 [Acidimicrobiales bacterium]|nr:hypothetical protein [Acidimicrobiales bacterium]